MSLRRLGVIVHHLPADSATAIACGGSGWRIEDFLLADLFHATSGNPHPANPRNATPPDLQREKKIEAFKARVKERQRQIDAKEIT